MQSKTTSSARGLQSILFGCSGGGIRIQALAFNALACSTVLWFALKSSARRFLMADAILNYVRRHQLVRPLAGPVRYDCEPPDTAKGRALASLCSHSDDSWLRARYTLDLACTGECMDPLRLLAPDFHLPAEFAHARCIFARRFRRLRRVLRCHKCGERFKYLWHDFAWRDACSLRLIIGLVRPWLRQTACATIP